MRVLVVEDDEALARRLTSGLSADGHAVDHARDGEEGAFWGEERVHDAIVLDLGLPKIDGVTVLTRWRRGGVTTPVLILTARDHWHDKVAGIDAGADDYLTKPFRMEELRARVRALIRRAAGHASSEIVAGRVALNTATARVTLDGEAVEVTGYEYRVLSYLMHRKGRPVSRAELTEHVYAQDFERDSNTLEVFVGRLRRKLGTEVIRTVRGLGYVVDE